MTFLVTHEKAASYVHIYAESQMVRALYKECQQAWDGRSNLVCEWMEKCVNRGELFKKSNYPVLVPARNINLAWVKQKKPTRKVGE